MLKSILKYTRVSSNQEFKNYEYRFFFIDNSLSYSYFNYIRGVKTVNYLIRIIPQLPRELPSCLLWYVIVLVIGQKIIISYLVSYSFNKVNDRIHNLILKIA